MKKLFLLALMLLPLCFAKVSTLNYDDKLIVTFKEEDGKVVGAQLALIDNGSIEVHKTALVHPKHRRKGHYKDVSKEINKKIKKVNPKAEKLVVSHTKEENTDKITKSHGYKKVAEKDGVMHYEKSIK